MANTDMKNETILKTNWKAKKEAVNFFSLKSGCMKLSCKRMGWCNQESVVYLANVYKEP